jgi:hypothetical protein
MVYAYFFAVVLLTIVGCSTLSIPSFGKLPTGERLARIQQSPNYDTLQHKFKNQSPTTIRTTNKSTFRWVYDYLFPKNAALLVPTQKVPAQYTNLTTLADNHIVWLGHSSYFMKADNKNILIDPVFHSAAPLSFIVKPFPAEYNYSATDLPEVIDILIITHDHWDHLDYKLMKQIKSRIKHVVCTLGVGSHLEYWGFLPANITELDWYQEATVDNLQFTSLPTRHFSGRGLKRAQTLWGSFLLQTSQKQVYIGGDSGYGTHFAQIGKQYPQIDFAILENGQYNEDWANLHTLPPELPKVMENLKAKRYFTGHNSKFKLSQHPWDEPLQTLKKIKNEHPDWQIEEPKIGRPMAI